jgi:hypothetical protein
MAKPYGWKWRRYTRREVLARVGAVQGVGPCQTCHKVKKLDVAHLDGDNGNDDPGNLAALCRKCHCRRDYPVAQPRAKETRLDRKDAGRPLLDQVRTFLERGQSAQGAVDEIIAWGERFEKLERSD